MFVSVFEAIKLILTDVFSGFFLGRFATDKTLQKLKMEISEISKKITTLDKNLKSTFHDSLSNANCSAKIKCEHWKLPTQVPQEVSSKSLLDELNRCFSNG